MGYLAENLIYGIMEASGVYSKHLYFLSPINMDGCQLAPKIPNNYFTQNGYEDNETPRICFAPSIDKCLIALSRNCTGEELYVHIPRLRNNTLKRIIHKPTIDQVPDSGITGEIWVTNKIPVMCIGKIKVTGDDGKRGHKFKYGNNKEAELYGWKWEWIEKY